MTTPVQSASEDRRRTEQLTDEFIERLQEVFKYLLDDDDDDAKGTNQ